MPPKKITAAPAPNAKRARKTSNKSDKTEQPPPKKKKRAVGPKASGAPKVPDVPTTPGIPTGKQHDVITIDDDETASRIVKTEPKREVVAKKIPRLSSDNLAFEDGDVVIHLESNGIKSLYLLHSSVLRRASSWFDESLRLKFEGIEYDPRVLANHSNPIMHQLRARYDLDTRPGPNKNTLVRTVSQPTFPYGDSKPYDHRPGKRDDRKINKELQKLTYLKEPESPPEPTSISVPVRIEIEIKDDPVERPYSPPSPGRQKMAESQGDVDMVDVPQLRTAEAKKKTTSSSALPVAARNSMEIAMAETRTHILQDVSLIKEENPDDDIVTASSILATTPEAKGREDIPRILEQQHPAKQLYELPSPVLSPVTDEKQIGNLAVHDEDTDILDANPLDDADAMEGVENTAFADMHDLANVNSMAGVEGIKRQATVKESFSVAKSGGFVETLAVEDNSEGEEIQTARSKAATEQEHRLSAVSVDFIEGKPDLKNGDIPNEIMITADSDNTSVNGATEGLGEGRKGYSETAGKVLLTEEGSVSTFSPSINASPAVKVEDHSSQIFTAGCQIAPTDHREHAASSTSEPLQEEPTIKYEEENAFNPPFSTPQIEPPIKGEGADSSSGQTVEKPDNKNGHLAGHVSPGRNAASTTKGGSVEVHTCTQGATEETTLNLATAAGANEDKTGEEDETSTVVPVFIPDVDHETPGFPEGGTGNLSAANSQLDGPSDKKTSKDRSLGQHPLSVGVTRPKTSTKKSREVLPSSSIIEKPAATRNKVAMVNEVEPEAISSRSATVKDTFEPNKSGLQPSTPTQTPGVQITRDEKVRTAPYTMAKCSSGDAYHAHINLIFTYYSRAPTISTQNIQVALKQSELLLDAARMYGSIPIVRPYINSALMQFGRELYLAVMADAPRWLCLAFYLESAPIFREAVIHIVGNYRYWSWPTLKFEDIFSPIAKLIDQKLHDFLTMKESVNKSLWLNAARDVRVYDRTMNIDDFDTWFVVQYWRDWFSQSLAEANTASNAGVKCVRGKVYRDLSRGGEAYLPTIFVLDALQACRQKDLHAKSKRQGVERDLKTLKEFAQKEVVPLCANYSMLCAEDTGIDYLTCIKVEHNELPWIKSNRN